MGSGDQGSPENQVKSAKVISLLPDLSVRKQGGESQLPQEPEVLPLQEDEKEDPDGGGEAEIIKS